MEVRKMAFKSVQSYNEERFGGFFLLRNDGDYADVIFLYQGVEDVLVADVHYIKSPDYSGYVHCCGKGCPACAKGIRTQTKLFIPVYNIAANEIQFFDRTMKFEPQLQHEVFSKYPNPSEYVFRITRHGAAGDVNTVYSIQATAKNSQMPYAQILSQHNAVMPDYYNTVCRDITAGELMTMLDSNDQGSSYTPTNEYNYNPVPRGGAPVPTVPTAGATPAPAPAFTEPPISMPADNIDSSDDSELGDPVF